MPKFLRALTRAVALCFVLAGLNAVAQSPAPKKKEPPRAAKPAPVTAVDPAPKGYRIGPRPAWVVEPPEPSEVAAATRAPAAGAARRELLVDVQSNYALPRPQTFFRHRAVALDASTLGTVSQQQIRFNPVFQNVVVHEASVLRDGRRLARLNDARIELMRREQRLEQQVIDGAETVLVVLNDVRVGEAVELVYTIEGENPIYEGRIAVGMQLAWDTPIELMHQRITAPTERVLQVRGIGTELAPERFSEGGRQILRIVRTQVAGIPLEQATPPWFKVYPALQVTEYASWAEVDAWAQRLFAMAPAGPALTARLAAFRESGLSGEALVAEVLRFVQDEVRYFSVSLGESSHRPKPAERTLAELLGDCKDKVVLLNALLSGLGFDVKPALVSMSRNRGLSNYLPSHEMFDHVITRLELGGSTYYLDATISGQGATLASRGYFPYGRALVVGAGNELQVVAEPPQALNSMEFEQRWDLSKPGAPAALTTVLRARGLAAERWRAGIAMGGEQRVAEAMAGLHARVTPGLKTVGAPRVSDDRQANSFELIQTFEHADLGQYSNGGLEIELAAIELMDALAGPPEARRRAPFMIDLPRITESRIELIAPRPFTTRLPAPTEVNDRHFRFSSRVDVDGTRVTTLRRIERRADEVLPGDLESFRENVLRVRQQSGSRVRLALLDAQALAPEFERIERKLRSMRGFRNDSLATLLMRNEVGRLFDGEVLKRIDAKSPLAARVLVARAEAGNLLGDFAASLTDADAALAIAAESDAALEARAVSLLGAGDVDAALAAFNRLAQTSRRPVAMQWIGSVEIFRGRHAEAEKVLRELVENGGGNEREFAMLWLYVAAEYQGGRGRAAIAPYVESADPKRLTGAMLRFLDGRMDRETMLKVARERAEMERLNLAEAYFYIGQQFAARGQREEALRWFTRTVETDAVPYREVTFAQLELRRGR